MLKELTNAIINSKKRLTEEYKIDRGVSTEKQTEKLLELEARLFAEETIPIFYQWLDNLKQEVISQVSQS